MEDFQDDLGIDKGGRTSDLDFADPNRMDFRLSQESMERVRECYPRGTVPGVELGMVPR